MVAAGEAGPDADLIGAQAADALGDLFAARTAITRAADAKPSGQLLAQVLMTRGVILLELGEAMAAVEDFRRCLELLAELPILGPVMTGVAWFNLGRALRETKDHAGAVAAYQRAAALFRAESMETYLCMALHNVAWALCFLGDASGAESALGDARPLCRSESLRWHQLVGEAFAASLGAPEERRHALSLCGRIIGESSAPGDVRSHACWVAGRAGLALGLLDEALAMAQEAVGLAIEARGSNRCLTDAAELLRQVKLARIQALEAGA